MNQPNNRIAHGQLTVEERNAFCIDSKKKGMYKAVQMGFVASRNPTRTFRGETIFPLAVLFVKGGK